MIVFVTFWLRKPLIIIEHFESVLKEILFLCVLLSWVTLSGRMLRLVMKSKCKPSGCAWLLDIMCVAMKWFKYCRGWNSNHSIVIVFFGISKVFRSDWLCWLALLYVCHLSYELIWLISAERFQNLYLELTLILKPLSLKKFLNSQNVFYHFVLINNIILMLIANMDVGWCFKI